MVERVILAWLLLTFPVQATETLMSRVVGVHDGDTLTLLVQRQPPVKVRLAGIESTELAQPYGQKAKQAIKEN